MIEAATRLPPEVLDAIKSHLRRSPPSELCTGRIVGALVRQFPDLEVDACDLARAIARLGLERGTVVHVSDEPV